ncbi:hypothetical protein [Ruegeria arenilitoris]|uniref:hypothetical protein n=1 Tax=Ruegeria arenilitoris TaxID=1173585 RepID=UPI00147AB0AF|nr:hypothetical protein [Ruegeria arenilitoris]
MIHLERSLETRARRQAIWATSSRFMHIDEFAPKVKSVDALTNDPVGVGLKRHCHFEAETSLVHGATDWQPNIGYRERLSEMSAMPLTDAHPSMAIEPISATQSKVI